MARKKDQDKDIEEIQNMLAKNKVMVGTKRTLAALRKGALTKIYLTCNCPVRVQDDVNYYARLAECDVIGLKYDNENLGTLCKKPFSISVVGLLRE